MNRLLSLTIFVFCVFSLNSEPAIAQNLLVNTLDGGNDGSCDAGGTGPNDDCSLLEALDAANASTDPAVIEFSVSGTITPEDTPTILTPVTLDGTSAPGGTRSVAIRREVPQQGFRIGVLVSGIDASGSIVQGLTFTRRLLGPLGDSTGVRVEDASSVTVGGSELVEGNNFIEADSGVQVFGAGSSNAVVRGNVITGNNRSSFDYSISIRGAPNATVGGPGENDGNVISEAEYGIYVWEDEADGPTIIGNTLFNLTEDAIRLNAGVEGGVVQANTIDGASEGIVLNSASGHVIGGLGEGEGNVITAGYGINIVGICPDNRVLGNEIISTGNFGIRLNSSLAIGNEFLGNHVTGGSTGLAVSAAPDTTVGGAGPGEGNIIADAEFAGISMQFDQASGWIVGNEITGNSEVGIYIENAVSSVIGGTEPGEGNVISGPQTGISVWDRNDNNILHAILGNSISASAQGIDLTDGYPLDGVTPNDGAPDSDTGANGFQNFPLVTLVEPGVGIDFTLASTPDTTFRIEAFASAASATSGSGPGERFLGFVEVTTDGSGNVSGTAPAADLVAGEFASLTATALDNSTPSGYGGTSEFSMSVLDPDSDLIFKDNFGFDEDGLPSR